MRRSFLRAAVFRVALGSESQSPCRRRYFNGSYKRRSARGKLLNRAVISVRYENFTGWRNGDPDRIVNVSDDRPNQLFCLAVVNRYAASPGAARVRAVGDIEPPRLVKRHRQGKVHLRTDFSDSV